MSRRPLPTRTRPDPRSIRNLIETDGDPLPGEEAERAGLSNLGIYLPPRVLNCPDLVPATMVLLSLVIQLNDPRLGCYASISTLAERVRVNRSSVTRMIAELRARGLIVRHADGGLRPAPVNDPVWTASPRERGRPVRKTPAMATSIVTKGESLALDRRSESEPVADGVSKSLAEVAGPPSPTGPMRAGRARSQGTRKTSPLEDKLVEICGLETLVGTKAFPGSRFGKCLSILRELNATPEELGRYLAWWSDQAISFKRDYPTLEQVSGTFHQSRTSKGPRPQSRPAAGAAPDPGAWSLRDPEGFAKAHPVDEKTKELSRIFQLWKARGKDSIEAMDLAVAGVEPE